MNLSERLKAVSDMVLPCDKVADIGCDHGYVTIDLLKKGKVKEAIASDINEGPLAICRTNIEKEGLSERVKVIRSDGFSALSISDDIDSCVIAGMGGRLMTRILSEKEEVVTNLKQMVLQPQSEIFLVRRWIRENGFRIESEKMVREDGKYYFLMDVRPGMTETKEFTEIYDSFSEYLIEVKDPLLIEYLERGVDNDLKYLKGIEGSEKGKLSEDLELKLKALKMMGVTREV